MGQSIDSADYAAFEAERDRPAVVEEQPAPQPPSKVNDENKPTTNGQVESSSESKQSDVEEAVIKIQALVRGHLTRKALKDAHQHSAPNALGQSQFDEDSLIGNRKY